MKRWFGKTSLLALLLGVAMGGCKSPPADRTYRHDHYFYCFHCGFHHSYSHFHYHYYYYDRRPATQPSRVEVNPAPLPEPPALPSPRPPRPLRSLKQPELPF